MSVRDMLLALLIVAVWGVNFVFVSWGVADLPPLLLSSLRFMVAAVPLVFFIKRPPVAWGYLVGYGMLMGVIQFSLIFSAIKMGFPAGLSSVVLQVQPFFTIALSVVFLGERLRPMSLVGALIAFAGIVVIAYDSFSPTSLLLLAMMMGAALSWAGSNIVAKLAGDIDKFAFLVWSCIVPPIPLLLGSLLLDGPATVGAALLHPGWGGVAGVLYTAFASTLLAYGLWVTLLGRYPASVVAPFSLLVPVFGVGSTALLLGERLSGLEVAGSVVVLLGLALNTFAGRPRRNLTPPT